VRSVSQPKLYFHFDSTDSAVIVPASFFLRGLPRVRASNESDPTIVEAAEVDIARAKGIAKIGPDTGRGRESLAKPCPQKAIPTLLRS
jgi:hypothetical protein